MSVKPKPPAPIKRRSDSMVWTGPLEGESMGQKLPKLPRPLGNNKHLPAELLKLIGTSDFNHNFPKLDKSGKALAHGGKISGITEAVVCQSYGIGRCCETFCDCLVGPTKEHYPYCSFDCKDWDEQLRKEKNK